MISYKVVQNEKEFQVAYKIRVEVFVNEQKVPIDMELDEDDKNATHILIYKDDVAIGCGRLVFHDDYVKMGRVAIRKSERLKGYGQKLCLELINLCKQKKCKQILIHAQCNAIKFYKKLGFEELGEVFDEAGIDHIKMVKKLL